jgi:pimeloyl-ACP methyl ester carboxylesterase
LSRVSGYVNNGNVQVAILEQLVNYIRGGKLSTAYIPVKPQKVILVGHSYGSVLSNALLAANPDIADGAVLTGWNYAFNAPFVLASVQLRIANQLYPAQYKGYDTGALCFMDLYAAIQL